MGSTSEWGKTVIAARDKPANPMTIDGMPWKDYIRMMQGGGSPPPAEGGSKVSERSLSPMQIMLEGNRDEKSMRALSDGLRNRKEVGEMASLLGTRNQREFGGSLRDDVRAQQGLKEKQDQRSMTQGYYDQSDAHRKNVLTESIRHNKAMEEAAALRAQAAASGTKFKAPSVSAIKKTEQSINEYEGIRRTLAGYKKDYANNTFFPWEGGLSNTVGKFTGTDAQKDQARWWADYDLLYTLGTRNKLFGSALTDSEIKAWEGANISPNSPPDVIERGLKTLMEIADRKFKQSYSSDSTLYLPEWVDSVYAPYLGAPQDTSVGAPPDAPPMPGSGVTESGYSYEVTE